MSSNVGTGMVVDPGQGPGHHSTLQQQQQQHRNVHFGGTSSSQQQQQQSLSHHMHSHMGGHNHHSQDNPHQQQQHMGPSGHPPMMPSSASSSSISSSDAPGGSFAPRSVSTSSLSQLNHSSSQQHSPQYSYAPSSSFSIQQQQQQQRPPIPPNHHQPRLHHSVSAGNIAMMAQSGRYGGGSSGVSEASGFGGGGLVGASSINTVGGGRAIAPPKKKDPYATAWRTYSKIAEELQLLNPDGSLYPISKEAILKYLHHQSKRIKSSNLHWYVNGLKKHQENLGFPWDDVRYDEQVVGLLKELTLHPVMVGESNSGGGDDEHYGYGSNRQRQASGGIYPLGAGVGNGRTGGHHHSSSSIDTTRIANLSISQPPPSHAQAQQQQQHGQVFVNVGLKQQQQQAHHHSRRIQQPPPPKPCYHSAPTHLPNSSSSSGVSGLHARTPSTQDLVGVSAGLHQNRTAATGLHQQQQQHSQQQQPLSHALRSEPMAGGAHVSGALSKRKRDDFAFKKRRMPSSMSMEGDDHDRDELQDDDFKGVDDDDLYTHRGNGHYHNHRDHHHDPDDSDEMEDSNRYQPLKRRASTGTLLSQARASAINHVPEPFAIDGGHTQDSTTYPSTTTGSGAAQPQRTLHHRISSSGLSGAANQHHNLQSRRSHQNLHHHHQSSKSSQHHPQQHHLRSPSPELWESTSSSSHHHPVHSHHHQRQHSSSLTGSSDSRRFRHPSGGSSTAGADTEAAGAPSSSFRTLDGAAASTPSAATTQAPIKTAGKTTVQFSDVVQCASQLQAKYGLRCKDHPWGCVEITEDRHLELTMKMYLDWAGLVASERLTMDELPDLPDFRDIHTRPSNGGTEGGILKRMASTPLSSSLASVVRGDNTSGITSSRPTAITATRVEGDASDDEEEEVTTPTRTTTASYFGAYRSPSFSSPQSHTTTTTTTLVHEKDTPTSEDGPSEDGLVDHHHRTRVSTASSSPHTILRPASAIERRSRPTSPDGEFTPSSVAVVGEGSMVMARARKMPSTPSLRQQHHDDQYIDHHQLYRHDSARAQHSQLSPPLPRPSSSGPSSSSVAVLRGHLRSGSIMSDNILSDEEDEEVEDNEDNEEEEEDADVNHYALSPWATAPASILADARLRGSRNMGLTARRPNTIPIPAGLFVDSSHADEDVKKKAQSPLRDGVDDGDKGDSQSTTAMTLNSESSVLQIGELASHQHQLRHDLLTPNGGDDGDETVEVATHVLDSMMIGGRHRHRVESSSSSSEVVAMDVDEDMEGGGSGKNEVDG
ncbi:hypothetical protein BGZ47_005260, partial [Haplosporangium gracile]